MAGRTKERHQPNKEYGLSDHKKCIPMKCRHRKIGMLVAVLLAAYTLRAQPEPTIVQGYEFTTGVDSTLWFDMSNATPWPMNFETAYPLSFPIFLWDCYDTLYIYLDEAVSCVPLDYTARPFGSFPSQLSRLDEQFCGIFGYKNFISTSPDYPLPYLEHIRTAVFNTDTSSPGHRVEVIQLRSYKDAWSTANMWQLQLREEDNSITLVYGPKTFTEATAVSVGIAFDTSHIVLVDRANHTVSAYPPDISSAIWPEQYRYYRFTPSEHLCPPPRALTAEVVAESDNDVELRWHPIPIVGIDSFRVEYGPKGFAEGSGTSMTVDTCMATIQGVQTVAEMEARVYTQCNDGESESIYSSTTFSTCPPPSGFTYHTYLDNDNILLCWDSLQRYHSYRVEYGPAGFAEGNGTVVTTNTASLMLFGLPPGEDMEARVYANCTYGESEYANLFFHTHCQLQGSNWIRYANIHNNSAVKCCTFADYYSPYHIVDSGSFSSFSRHTIHYDTSERDRQTGYLLRTVPNGFCSSVRLGNWRNMAEHEGIFYTLQVDTSEYNLLILRYAIVAENPNHPNPLEQPRFEFDILDETGQSINSCYYGNFVSGDLSGWNTSLFNTHVLWHDWDAIGVDLTPLHGQTIKVAVTTHDCSLGQHFGYAYFTLESASKRIMAFSCGDSVENTFVAPEGFTYRWYSMSDTATTLSTQRTLHVTQGGDYGCHVTYQLSDQVCGFDLTTYAGGRFPYAAFSREPVDSCGRVTRFVNHSVIASDEALTQLTSFPCDEYRWVVDDSLTYTSNNLTHRFDEGSHTVTLYAMLAGGQCIDSTTQTFTVNIAHDTIHADICQGKRYLFFGQSLTEAGEYQHHEDCGHTVLYLQVHPTYDTLVYDTFLLGESYQFEGFSYQTPGIYEASHRSIHHCDSTIRLHLSCINLKDTTVCTTSLPLEWDSVAFGGEGCDTLHLTATSGTDSLVVHCLHEMQPPTLSIKTDTLCQPPGEHLISLPDSLCYLWASLPADSTLPSGWTPGSSIDWPLHLSPSDTTAYYLVADRCNDIPCPAHDTLQLAPVAAVSALLEVYPNLLDNENLDLYATDLTLQPHSRQWAANGIPSSQTGDIFHYLASMQDDTVRVMLIATTEHCTDTATATIPVRLQSIWFPNLFTPELDENNLFRAYGNRVRNYDLKVFTRWGDCIFHTTDFYQGWDGTYHGIKSPASAYVYLVHYTTPDGEPMTATGTVTLVR